MITSKYPSALLAAVLALACVEARAIQFSTSGTTGGGSVTGTVDFTLGAGSVSVVLTNTTLNAGNAAQLLSAIIFNVSGASGSGALTESLSAANRVTTISAGGAYTPGVADALTRWEASESGTAITMTTLSGGNPDRLVIGPDSLGNTNPGLGGLYSNANASVIGDNPNVLGSIAFTVTIPGATLQSTISNVVFQWGTTSGSNQTTSTPGGPGGPGGPGVPDAGSTLILSGIAMLGMGLAARRFRR